MLKENRYILFGIRQQKELRERMEQLQYFSDSTKIEINDQPEELWESIGKAH